jgi:uncharacterized protein (DUF58 family)
VPGDDRRHVNWKSMAKTGKLMVRQYNDTRRSHVAVLLSLDESEYASEAEFELAVSAAASIGKQVKKDGQQLTMIAGGTEVRAPSATLLLDRCSGFEWQDEGGGTPSALRTARRVAADASVAFVCVGSTPTVVALRRAVSRVSFDAPVIIVRAAPGERRGYKPVGRTRVVTVPRLDDLERGLAAVLA